MGLQVQQQIRNIRASVATRITQEYNLRCDGIDIAGRSGKGEVAVTAGRDSLQIYMTEECVTAECPPFELIDMIEQYTKIKGSVHRGLLQIALTDQSLIRIQATVLKQGINIELPFLHEGPFLYLYC